MDRRRYLRVAAGGVVTGLAGCTGRFGSSGGGGNADAGGNATTGFDLPIPRSEMRRGAGKDAIPAITDPVFDTDWSGVEIEVSQFGRRTRVEPRLRDDDRVVGVVRDGAARAYPLRILNWHEIVNDDFGGPLLVTYCPLCGSSVTGVRAAGGEVTTFGVSGLLWRNDLVMYDAATSSLWSQIIATAINGELTGETLELVPSTLTTLAAWRADHPDTVVLRPPPESGTVVEPGVRDYTTNPYAGYENTDDIGLGGGFDDDRLHPKTQVLGIARDGEARAYPLDAVQRAGVVNDTVGDLPVVVTSVGDNLVAYVRTVDTESVEFSADGPRHLAAAGSRWIRATGAAVDGPHEGTRLEQANDVSPLFWFAWLDFHPDSSVYGN